MATFNEWCMSALILVLMGTFVPDFLRIRVEHATVIVTTPDNSLADKDNISTIKMDEVCVSQ